jgi:hypothetical protein
MTTSSDFRSRIADHIFLLNRLPISFGIASFARPSRICRDESRASMRLLARQLGNLSISPLSVLVWR